MTPNRDVLLHQTSRPVWCVVGTSYGGDTPTWGPFETYEEARAFADSAPGRRVYDDVVNRASVCGPWLL